MQLSAAGFSQGITLSEKNAKLESIFTKIFQQTGYEFFYNSSIIEKAKTVSIQVNNQSLDAVLALCFKDQPLDYELKERTVVIKEKNLSKVPSLITITGVVTSESDELLEGVTIRVKNTGKGAITDAKGEFVLRDIAEDAVLIFSSIGFDQQEINTNGKPRISIRLKVAVKGLDQTIVIGYGQTRKRFNTGSVGKIDNENIITQPVSNPIAAMQGRIPGVSITQATGVAGGAFSVSIRGINSLANGNEPLYIVDGIPYPSSGIGSTFSNLITRYGSPLNNINPSDIESISVLKDAEATSIYGSRGANGVILITTRKGSSGPLNVNINVYTGWSRVTRKMDLLNTRQYLDMRHEAFVNDGETMTGGNARDILVWDTMHYTDWQKLLIGGNAQNINAQVSISGGSPNIQYMAGVNYHKETTVFPGDFADHKISGHIKLNSSSVNQKFKAAVSANYSVDDNNLLPLDPTIFSILTPPDAPPIYDSNGKLNWGPDGATFTNPFSQLLQKYTVRTSDFLSNVQLSYEIIKNLIIKTSIGYNSILLEDKAINPLSSYNPSYGISSGDVSEGLNSIQTWILEPQAEYRTGFSGNTFSFLVGSTLEEDDKKNLENYATGFSSDLLIENMAAATTRILSVYNKSIYRYNAIFGRISYNRNNKYLVNLNARRDGSSRFGPGRQFANFGSVSVGWIFSKEKLIEDKIHFLSYGKIRSSYGTTGNDQIGEYGFLDLWNNTTYPYSNSSGIYPTRLLNPDYGWEVNKKFEAAVELGFFKDRLYFSAAWFTNRSSNQLLTIGLPGTTGFTGIKDNLDALVENSGLELELSASIVKTKRFEWKSNANLSVPKSKLVSYPGIEKSAFANTYSVGKPLDIFKGLHATGVDPATGTYQFEDVNKDGSISYPQDISDKKRIGRNYYGGWQNIFQYKNWNLSLFFEFVKQTGKTYIYSLGNAPGMRSNQPTIVLNRWQKPGDITSIQRYTQSFDLPYYEAYSNSYSLSDNAIGDASFIRLKNFSLSYNLPDNTLKRLKLKTFRIFIECQNILTVTKYKGYDPENQSTGYLPPLKTLAGGIDLNF